MYNNIGRKIKGLAKVTFIVEAIAAVLSGIVLLIEGSDDLFFISIPLIFLGPIVAWISSWLLYGFGELIDKTCDIAKNTSVAEKKPE